MESNHQAQTKPLTFLTESTGQFLHKQLFRNLGRNKKAPSKFTGKQGSGDARGNCLIISSSTKFSTSIEELKKNRHLNYGQTSVDKQVSTIKLMTRATNYLTQNLQILSL